MNKKLYESPMFEVLEVEVEDCLGISKVSGDPVYKDPETPVHEQIETLPTGGFFDGNW